MRINPNVIITSEGVIEVEITEDMMARAQAKAVDLGQLKNSIREGEGNLAGFLGEEAVLIAFSDAESANTYQHDVRLPDRTWEVKSKDRTVLADDSYEGSVAAYNTRQGADEYVFCSVYREGGVRGNSESGEYTMVQIMGTQEKSRYYRRARFLKEGDLDAWSRNNFTVQADCFNVYYRMLDRPWFDEQEEQSRTA
jgi:hypothetical protein